MATSSFGKKFVLPKESVDEFVEIMTREEKVSMLDPNFESKVQSEKELREHLLKAIGKD